MLTFLASGLFIVVLAFLVWVTLPTPAEYLTMGFAQLYGFYVLGLSWIAIPTFMRK